MNSTLYATKGIVVKKLLLHAEIDQAIYSYDSDGIISRIQIDDLKDDSFYSITNDDVAVMVVEVRLVDNHEALQRLEKQFHIKRHSV